MAVFLESYGDKRNSGYHLNTNGDLCVLTKTTNDVSQNSYSLKNCHAESLVVKLWGETAAPGAIVIAKTDDNSDEHPVFPNNSGCEVPPVPLALDDLRRISQPATLSLCHPPPRRRKSDREACRVNNAGRSVERFSIPGMRERKFSISGMMRYLPRRIGTTFSPTYPWPPTMTTGATS